MTAMTYGTLPTREEFDAAFERECPNGYAITLGRADSDAVENFKLGDGTWTAGQLWAAITEIVNASQVAPDTAEQAVYYARLDLAMDLVSGIMTTLGFEWV